MDKEQPEDDMQKLAKPSVGWSRSVRRGVGGVAELSKRVYQLLRSAMNRARTFKASVQASRFDQLV